jgi:hypothetical protein
MQRAYPALKIGRIFTIFNFSKRQVENSIKRRNNSR